MKNKLYNWLIFVGVIFIFLPFFFIENSPRIAFLTCVAGLFTVILSTIKKDGIRAEDYRESICKEMNEHTKMTESLSDEKLIDYIRNSKPVTNWKTTSALIEAFKRWEKTK